jgi:4-hydroxymandelate oxidase
VAALQGYEERARELLRANVFAHLDSGAGDEVTKRDNDRAWDSFVLRPRLLAGVDAVSTETTVLGVRVGFPVLVAPMGFQELATASGAVAAMRAAARAGAGFVAPTISQATPAELVGASPRWFQLYSFRDRSITRSLAEQAADAGYDALTVTVDSPAIGRRDRALRGGWTPPGDMMVGGARRPLAELNAMVDAGLSWRDLDWLAGFGLPLVLKGVLTREDAELAVDHGAVGIVVSNHGGRQLDGAVTSASALPEVVRAVDGRAEVFVDGGIRSGAHVVTALALGARAVLIGRPILWALAAGGEQALERALAALRDEVARALALVGCEAPAQVSALAVTRSP